jgi:hypothetical protein
MKPPVSKTCTRTVEDEDLLEILPHCRIDLFRGVGAECSVAMAVGAVDRGNKCLVARDVWIEFVQFNSQGGDRAVLPGGAQ